MSSPTVKPRDLSATASPPSTAGLWDELVSVALLGTDRRPLSAAPPGPLARFGGGDDPAVALLDRAAAVQAARRAGQVASSAGERLPPCPTDPRAPCPTPAARRLGLVLQGQHPELLDELVEGIVTHGYALPPEHLVSLLHRSRSEPALRRTVLAGGGPVVPWLAAILPLLDWPTRVASERDLAEGWERGSPAERVELLRHLRVTDPAKARELLATGLSKERAEHRAACLATLLLGLSEADEPLLEAALDDRGASVREVAVDLLARLPTSAWAARMATRANHMVHLETGPGGERLAVHLVAPVPPAWERDGMGTATPPGASLGLHVLHQAVAGAPLRSWEALGRPPYLIALATEHELGEVLLGAWAEAATRQRDHGWAGSLVEETADPGLVAALAPEDLVVTARRRANPDAVLTPQAIAVFATLPAPWPADLRRSVAGALIGLFVDRRIGRHHGPLLNRLVRALDPAVLVPLAGALDRVGLPPPLDGVRDDVGDLARFRAAMLEELAQEGSS